MRSWWLWCWAWLTTVAFAEGPCGLAGAERDAALDARVKEVITRWVSSSRTNALKADQVAATVLDLSDPARLKWGAHRGDAPIYPASVVKLFYLEAAQRWIEDGRLEETEELQRAMRDMIVLSYNEATHYVVDLLTATTSGPELSPALLGEWHEKRNAVNRHFTAMGYRGINCNKKPWCEGPYGRESQAIKAFEPRRNMLTTDAATRLMAEIALDRVVTPARCAGMRALLSRDPSAEREPEDQVHGFVGSGLPKGAKLWSKAGWTSQTRHDCALVELPGGRRWVVTVFTEGHAQEEDLVPGIARGLLGVDF